jgi:antitoxin HicB
MSKLLYPFNISILPTEEGGGYLIEFPDLPGCISDGETIDEAIANGKDALFCWIETAKQHGDEVPQPHSSFGL